MCKKMKDDLCASNPTGLAGIDVYLLPASVTLSQEPLLPRSRDEEVRTIKNEKVRREKYRVWRTLLYALRRSAGLSPEDVSFARDERGKWRCDGPFFSLSHCDGLSAAAVSDRPVGIDAESIAAFLRLGSADERLARLSQRVCAVGEKPPATAEAFLALWTQKESVYKYENERVFRPSEIAVGRYPLLTFGIEEWIVSVCGEATKDARIYLWDGTEAPPQLCPAVKIWEI